MLEAYDSAETSPEDSGLVRVLAATGIADRIRSDRSVVEGAEALDVVDPVLLPRVLHQTETAIEPDQYDFLKAA